MAFWRCFSFSRLVGYVSSLEGSNSHLPWTTILPNLQSENSIGHPDMDFRSISFLDAKGVKISRENFMENPVFCLGKKCLRKVIPTYCCMIKTAKKHRCLWIWGYLGSPLIPLGPPSSWSPGFEWSKEPKFCRTTCQTNSGQSVQMISIRS